MAFPGVIFPLMKHSSSEAFPGRLPQQLTYSRSFRSLLSGDTPQVDPDMFSINTSMKIADNYLLFTMQYEKYSTKPPYLILKTTLRVEVYFSSLFCRRGHRGVENLRETCPG